MRNKGRGGIGVEPNFPQSGLTRFAPDLLCGRWCLILMSKPVFPAASCSLAAFARAKRRFAYAGSPSCESSTPPGFN